MFEKELGMRVVHIASKTAGTAVAATLAVLAICFAQTASASSANSPRSAQLSAIAESIQVRIQGISDLSGTYRLNEDETISIPGVGRISIAAMTASDLEKALASRILGATGRAAPVSVEVSTYRQVFVAGYVDKPGSFQWQRGMTVVKAVSMSGGVYRPPAALPQSELARDGALEIARLELAQALVDRARLQAELDDRDLIETPERLIGVIGANRSNDLIQSEQAVLANRRNALKLRLKNIDDLKTAVTAEIDRLQILAKTMKSRVDKYGPLLTEMRKSYKRGRLSNQRLFQVETQIANLEEKLASTNVQIVKAETTRQGLDSKRDELTGDRREKIIEALSKLATTIKTAQIRYDVARERLNARAAGPATSETTERATELTYEIVRQTSQGESRTDADRFDLLLPGDTLIVRQQNESRNRSVPTKTARGLAGRATR
jgi:protein involved in polysaccharide export with SLBB domain